MKKTNKKTPVPKIPVAKITATTDMFDNAVQKLTDIYENQGEEEYEKAVRSAWKSPLHHKELGCLFAFLSVRSFTCFRQNGNFNGNFNAGCPTIVNELLHDNKSGWDPGYLKPIDRYPELKKAIKNHPELPRYTMEEKFDPEKDEYFCPDVYPINSLTAFADIQRLANNLIPGRKEIMELEVGNA